MAFLLQGSFVDVDDPSPANKPLEKSGEGCCRAGAGWPGHSPLMWTLVRKKLNSEILRPVGTLPVPL